MDTQWKKIRDLNVNKVISRLAVVHGNALEDSYYYAPLSSDFFDYGDDVLGEEIEQQCERELKLLLSGFQSDNIRIAMDQHGRPCGLDTNPSFQPFTRSVIGRFSDVIVDLYQIRSQCHMIDTTLCWSRYAKIVARSISQKVDELLDPIIIEEYHHKITEQERALVRLSHQVNNVKTSIKKYAEIISHLYAEKLVGGQVLDYLDTVAYKSFGEQSLAIRSLWQIVWSQFAETCSIWIGSGKLQDPTREFFIWSADTMTALEARKLRSENITELNESSSFLVIPDLCPQPLKKHMAAILRCGLYCSDEAFKSQNPARSIKWLELDPNQFIRMLISCEEKGASAIYKTLRVSANLDNVIEIIHSTLLKHTGMVDMYRILLHKGLLDRPNNEVGDEVLRDLTRSILHRNVDNIPALSWFKFVKDQRPAFDALRTHAGFTSSGSEEADKTDVPCLPDVLSVELTLPPELAKIFTFSQLRSLVLLFRLQMKLAFASGNIEESRNELSLSWRKDKNRDNQMFRAGFQMLSNLEKRLLLIRGDLISVIAARSNIVMEKLDKIASSQELVSMCIAMTNGIFKDCGMAKSETLSVTEELLAIIDDLCRRQLSLDLVIEKFNEWTELAESLTSQIGQ